MSFVLTCLVYTVDLLHVSPPTRCFLPSAVGLMDRIHNLLENNRIAFVTTAKESDGALTKLKVEAAPGASTFPHYHTRFSKSVEVLRGVLTVDLDGAARTLHRGHMASIGREVPHQLSNTSDEPAEYTVEIRPGHADFETRLYILYGLARDEELDEAGHPKQLMHRAALTRMGDTIRTDVSKPMQWFLRGLSLLPAARRAEQELRARYVPVPSESS